MKKVVKTVIVDLPEPCAEDWEQMQPLGCGRFCLQCQKTVIDFTLLSDEQVARLLSHASGQQLCGRFSEIQLNRPLVVPAPPQQSNWLRKLAAVATLLLPHNFLLSEAKAQKTAKTTLIGSDTSTTASQPICLDGTIKDILTEKPLPGMEINIDGLNKQYSDRNGHFSFFIPDSWTGRQITVSAAYPSSGTPKEATTILEETLTIEAGKKHYHIALNRYPMGTIGEGTTDSDRINVEVTRYESYRTHGGAPVVYVKTVIPKYSFWQKITKPFRHKKRN